MDDNKVIENLEQEKELTAGEMLRNARTTGRRKREIPTIAKQLCIREEFLQALEDGNYTFIPELVYILGFARNYAMELGLDPNEIVTKIKRELGVVSDCVSADTDCDSFCNAGAKDKFDPVVMVKRIWAFVRRNWYWFLGGLVVVAVAVAVCLVLWGTRTDAPEADAGAKAEIVEVAVTEPEYKTKVRERWGTENRKDAEIILQAARESWVKIEDARGKTEFSRVLVAGDVYYLPVKGNYKATFGDAGGIDIWVKGKLAPKAGPDHTRKSDIALTADSLMSGDKDKKADKSDKKEKITDKKQADKSNKASEYGSDADFDDGAMPVDDADGQD